MDGLYRSSDWLRSNLVFLPEQESVERAEDSATEETPGATERRNAGDSYEGTACGPATLVHLLTA